MEKEDFLKTVQVFKGFDSDELSVIAKAAAERRLKKGEELFAEGSSGSDFFIIKEGCITIFKKVAGGRKRNLTNLDKGKILGELALFDKEPRSAQAEATEDSFVYTFNIRQFEEILAGNLTLGAKFYRNIIFTLCSRLRDTNEKLNQGVIWGFKTQA